MVGALRFALVTPPAPWFVVRPAREFGVLATRLLNRLRVSDVTVFTHLMFELGLYTGTLTRVSD